MTYTPTTDEVRDQYSNGSYISQEHALSLSEEVFDRWYANEIRKAKAQAWDEGYEAGCADMENGGNATHNPYMEES